MDCLDLELAELLLDRSGNVNASDEDEDGSTPLHNAVFKNELVKLLLDHSATVDATNWDDISALFLCSRSSHAAPSVRLLLDSRVVINRHCAMGETPLCNAVEDRRARMVEILLAEGVDPELADVHGRDCYGWISSISADWLRA